MWNDIASAIASATGETHKITEHSSLGGGCINAAYRVSDGRQDFFVKTNHADKAEMFTAEFAGLQEIQNSRTISVPQPVCFGTTGQHAFIVMQYLHLATRGGSGRSIAQLGVDLAKLHKVESSQFGWHRNNTIGSTPQLNELNHNWPEFWRDKRLGYQLQLVARNGYGKELTARGEKLLLIVDDFFSRHTPQASLLHGDLWSGNYAILENGRPVIFDPAVYYGDRETDIAMTELFGEFPAAFYVAYNDTYPLDNDYPIRKNLYNLYHILNHVNLFGGGYVSQARHMIDELLSHATG